MSRPTLVEYVGPAFVADWEPETGVFTTRYVGGHVSACPVVPDDQYHADRLGITAAEHRLLHELGHHLMGLWYYRRPDGSPVIWRDAHGWPQLEDGEEGDAEGSFVADSKLEEWRVTALGYLAMDRDADWGAMIDLQKRGISPTEAAAALRWLWESGRVLREGGRVTFPVRPGAAHPETQGAD